MLEKEISIYKFILIKKSSNYCFKMEVVIFHTYRNSRTNYTCEIEKEDTTESMVFSTLLNDKATVRGLCADTAPLPPSLLLKACASLDPCVRLFMLRVTNACHYHFNCGTEKHGMFFFIYIFAFKRNAN